jgi:rhodanese-related sulfurtransferase
MTRWTAAALAVSALFLLLRSQATADDGISASDAATLIKRQKDLQLIDVRTEGEYATGHLPGAKLIPVQEIGDRVAEIDKHKPVLLYCRTGHRSAIALRILEDSGFTRAKHIAGGINAWKSAGLPVTR